MEGFSVAASLNLRRPAIQGLASCWNPNIKSEIPPAYVLWVLNATTSSVAERQLILARLFKAGYAVA